MDAVTSGLGADIDDRLARLGAARIEDIVRVREADGHRIDQDIAIIAGVEIGLAAHCGHADAIAVAADTGHHAGDQVRGLGMVRRPKAQRIHQRHRTRAHGEDIAQDAADTGRRALIGLDEGGVVVALHLEDTGLAVADIDHTGILARPLDHLGAGGRQLAQMRARGLVGAVLGPHDRENPQFHKVRRPAQTVQDDGVFGVIDAVLFDDLGSDAFGVLGHGDYALPRRDSNSFSPSVPP